MVRLLTLLALLFLPAQSWAAWSFVQDNCSSGTSTTLTGVAAGNLIAVGVKYEEADATGDISVTDGTAPLTAGATHRFASFLGTSTFYKLVSIANAGTTTFTVSSAAAIEFPVVCVAELDYGSDTASFDTSSSATGTSTAPASGNISSTGSTIAAVGFHGNYGGLTSSAELIDGGAATNVERIGGASLWWLAGAVTTGGATATITSEVWGAHIMTFNATAGGGPTGPPVGTLGLMGVGR